MLLVKDTAPGTVTPHFCVRICAVCVDLGHIWWQPAIMDTAASGLRDSIDGATAAELRGVLLALEGRLVDVGKHTSMSFYAYCNQFLTARQRVHCVQRVPVIFLHCTTDC